MFIITCIQHVGGSPKEEVYLKKKNNWKVRQFLFGKLFRQTTSNRWFEKWDNLSKENYLDKKTQTYEVKNETISFQKIIETKKVKQMNWKVRQFLFRKLFRQTTSNRWVPRGCDALDKRLANDFVRGEIDLGWFAHFKVNLASFLLRKHVLC